MRGHISGKNGKMQKCSAHACATHEALEVLEKVGAEDWVTLLRRQKWRWAEKVVNHDADRWTRKILHWIPAEGVRVVGHPKLRWIDPLLR